MKIKKISQTENFFIIIPEGAEYFRYISKTPTSTFGDLLAIEELLIALCQFATNQQNGD